MLPSYPANSYHRPGDGGTAAGTKWRGEYRFEKPTVGIIVPALKTDDVGFYISPKDVIVRYPQWP